MKNSNEAEMLKTAKYLADEGNSEKSLSYIREYADFHKHNPKKLIECAELAEKLNDFLEAAKHYQSAINIKKNNAPHSWHVRLTKSYICVAEQHIEKGYDDQAIEALNLIEHNMPENSTVLVRYAKILEHLGKFEEACKMITKAINLRQDAPSWWYIRLAQLSLRLGKLETAIKNYEKAISLSPNQESWKTALNELIKKQNLGGNPLQASKSYYDEIYEKTEKYDSIEESNIYLEMWHKIILYLKQEKSKAILDVGCGPGQFAEFLLKHYKVNYTGLDFSETAIRKARERNPEALFYQEDILQSNMMMKLDFDTIICTEVLEHIEEDTEVLEKFSKGKFAICSVPSFDAFGHVRTFPNIESVKNRYGKYFFNFKVEKYLLPTKQYMYLFTGVVK